MAHWKNRPEKKWRQFKFNQPYEKGLERLKREVLAKTDFDPAALFQWGTMQAMAVIEILKECERTFGAQGQAAVFMNSVTRQGIWGKRSSNWADPMASMN